MASPAQASSLPAHHARNAALACAVVLAVALGVGRFAFTPLLPLMLKSGALDIRHGGWLASANYAGYLDRRVVVRGDPHRPRAHGASRARVDDRC